MDKKEKEIIAQAIQNFSQRGLTYSEAIDMTFKIRKQLEKEMENNVV